MVPQVAMLSEVRWATQDVYKRQVGAVLLVAVFGVYGPQFDASRFIYFQF